MSPAPMKVELESTNTTTEHPRGVSWDWTFRAIKQMKIVELVYVYPRMEQLLQLGPMLMTRTEDLRIITQMKVEQESTNTMERRGGSWDWIFWALK